jgi:predicted NUDIX family phosphoesterase
MEQVLVTSTELFLKLNNFTGFSASASKLLENNVFLNSLRYHDRALAENDPSLLQIIPYCIIVVPMGNDLTNHYFTYRRSKKGGENRLHDHDKYSIGVGGHINPCDGEPVSSYDKAMWRELNEELSCKGKFDNRLVGCLYDPSNDVGRVHCGFVHFIHMYGGSRILPIDDCLADGEFRSKEWLEENIECLENWSQIVVREVILK